VPTSTPRDLEDQTEDLLEKYSEGATHAATRG